MKTIKRTEVYNAATEKVFRYLDGPGVAVIESGAGAYPDLTMTSTMAGACACQDDNQVYCIRWNFKKSDRKREEIAGF